MKIYITIIVFGVCSFLQAQVSDVTMKRIYEEVKTPHKYGLVMVPKNNQEKIDCPSVFKKGKFWYMTYLVFDGVGYETWLAKSSDLLNWQSQGKILSFNADSTAWDAYQKAGYIALQSHKWAGNYQLQKFNNKYWLSYFGGNTKGYEAGLLSIGIANTMQDPTIAHEWNTVEKPVLTAKDNDVRWWEDKKLFKSTIIWDKQQTTGYPFLMYYNANGDTSKNRDKKTRWYERIGMAVSKDMLHWQRFQTNPVMHHPVGLTGDAMIKKIGKVWVMFYFGAFWKGKNNAFNRFACSYDLVNWTDWSGDDLIQPSETFDAKYAHKSFVVKWKGVVYHFYCAVNQKEQRGIAVATSVDKGKSALHFVQ